MEWHKADKYGADKNKIVPNERIRFESRLMIQNALLYFMDLKVEDSGVYYCSVNGTFGPGTEVQVVSKWTRLFVIVINNTQSKHTSNFSFFSP